MYGEKIDPSDEDSLNDFRTGPKQLSKETRKQSQSLQRKQKWQQKCHQSPTCSLAVSTI